MDKDTSIYTEEKQVRGIHLVTNKITGNYWEQPIGNYIRKGTGNVEKFYYKLRKRSFLLNNYNNPAKGE